jgi:hypothetical protein
MGGWQFRMTCVKTQYPIFKSMKAKRGGRVAQVVEHLPANPIPKNPQKQK